MQRWALGTATVGIILALGASASADAVACKPSKAPHTRNFCHMDHNEATNTQIRGKARVDRTTGTVSMTIEAGSDNLAVGACGTMTVKFFDKGGKELGTISWTEEVCGRGKAPGKGTNYRFDQTAQIHPTVAAKVAKVSVKAKWRRANASPFGVTPAEIAEGIKIAATLLAAL